MDSNLLRRGCAGFVVLLSGAAWAGPTLFPVPIGTNTTTITYDTTSGPMSFSATLDYNGPGASLNDLVHVPGSDNLGAFVAYNALGRRTEVIPVDPSVQAPNETLMRHGVYKFNAANQIDVGDDFFAGINVDGNVTLSITGITFDRPVQVRENTFLLHELWNIDQVDQLGVDGQGQPRAYNHPHNLHLVDGFRDMDSFFLGGSPELIDHPQNYTIGQIHPEVTHQAPNVIDVTLTFPYRLLTHTEDDGLGVPPGSGLPAPGGFLEPWHLHLEYLVVPEPASLALFAGGLVLTRRARGPRR